MAGGYDSFSTTDELSPSPRSLEEEDVRLDSQQSRVGVGMRWVGCVSLCVDICM